MSETKIKISCKLCGCVDVRKEADVYWNIATQRWEIAEIYSTSHCEKCGKETILIEEVFE